MDGQSRTCIEWMCNDEYEPGSFDLNNIMSPPDHESMFHSLMNATPLGGEVMNATPLDGEEWQAAGLATSPGGGTGRTLASLPSDPALITPTSLVSLVQHMELAPSDRAGTVEADREAGGSAADPATVPSLTQAVSEALGGGDGTEGDAAGRGLTRVSSAIELADLAELPAPRVRRPSISCPNSPPLPRRVTGNSFFTPSLFHPERSAEICREWHQHHQDKVDAVAGAGAAPAAVSGLPSQASLASAGGMTGPALPAAEVPRKKNRTKPRPSRLRELNFLAPSSM